MSTDAETRRIEYLDLDDIELAVRNPKNHDSEGIKRSISHFGLAEVPTLDGRTGRLVAGHGRIQDLRDRRTAGEAPPNGVTANGDRWLVPVLCGWASRSDEDAEAYLIASNNLSSRGGWDDTELGALLTDLNEVDPELLALTGFTDEDLAALLAEEDEPAEDDEPEPDDEPGTPPTDPVTKPGDIWLLGPHRVICGDCRDWSVVEKLMDGQRVNVAFTSPPYASQRKYDETSGFKPIPPDGYVDWFEEVQANVRAVLADDGSWFVNIKEHCDDRQRSLYVKDLTIAHVRRWGWRLVDELAWTRYPPPGRWPERFKNGWEPVFHYGGQSHIKFRPDSVSHASDRVPASASDVGIRPGTNNEHWHLSNEMTSGEALPTNVLSVSTEVEKETGHTAAFPAQLPAWFIRAYSDEGDAIFDPFMGSGTTLIAAHGEGRVGYGCEISPGYVDVICRRFEKTTGIVPILESTGEQVSFVSDEGEAAA